MIEPSALGAVYLGQQCEWQPPTRTITLNRENPGEINYCLTERDRVGKKLQEGFRLKCPCADWHNESQKPEYYSTDFKPCSLEGYTKTNVSLYEKDD